MCYICGECSRELDIENITFMIDDHAFMKKPGTKCARCTNNATCVVVELKGEEYAASREKWEKFYQTYLSE